MSMARRFLRNPLVNLRQQAYRRLHTTTANRTTTLYLSSRQPPRISYIAHHSGATTRFLSSSAYRAGQVKPFLLADIGEGITEVEIIKWIVNPDTVVEEFDNIVEVQSDKSSVEISSPYSGKIVKLHYEVGQVAKVGQPLCDIEIENGEADSPAVVPESTEEPQIEPQADVSISEHSSSSGQETSTTNNNDISEVYALATPSTRRIAKEYNVNLNLVKGTGKDGRVTKADVLEYVKAGSSPQPQSQQFEIPPSSAAAAQINLGSSTQSSKVEMSTNRKAMFRAMSNSLSIPHFGYSEELDVTELEKMRRKINKNIPYRYRRTLPSSVSNIPDRIDESGRFDKITLLPFFIKALSKAMNENPLFSCILQQNSPSSSSSVELVQRPDHDISIALSPPSGGLYTPLIANVNRLTILDIASNINRLIHIANSSAPPKFPPNLLRPGTITLSNVGMIGGTYTHPVIPPTGQLAIGAIGQTRVLPRYKHEDEDYNDLVNFALNSTDPSQQTHPQPQPRLITTVSFTADHRAVEGVELARLVQTWRNIIENPSLLLLSSV